MTGVLLPLRASAPSLPHSPRWSRPSWELWNAQVWRAPARWTPSRTCPGFWSVHSDRANMPTWGSVAGLRKEVCDSFGRWSGTGSSEYVRASRHMVTDAQATVAGAFREQVGGRDVAGEVDLFRALDTYLCGRNVNEERIREVLALLQYFGITGYAAPAALGQEPASPAAASTSSGSDAAEKSYFCRKPAEESYSCSSGGVVDPGLLDEVPSSEVLVSAAPAASPAAAESFTYIISTTARGLRKCLHIADGCYRARGYIFEESEIFSELPPATRYTNVCKTCWRQSAIAQRLSDEAGTDSSSSSSVSD